jgi:hypothetical protein
MKPTSIAAILLSLLPAISAIPAAPASAAQIFAVKRDEVTCTTDCQKGCFRKCANAMSPAELVSCQINWYVIIFFRQEHSICPIRCCISDHVLI